MVLLFAIRGWSSPGLWTACSGKLWFDQDHGGDGPTSYWRSVFPDVRSWRAPRDDPAALLHLQATGETDRRLWVQIALQHVVQKRTGERADTPAITSIAESAEPAYGLITTSAALDDPAAPEEARERQTEPAAANGQAPKAAQRILPHRVLGIEALSSQQWSFVRTHTDQAPTAVGARSIDDQVPGHSLRWWCEQSWGIAFEAVVLDPRAMPPDLAGWALRRSDDGWWAEHVPTGRMTAPYLLVSAALAAAEAVTEDGTLNAEG